MRTLLFMLCLVFSTLAFSQEQEVEFLIEQQPLKLGEKFNITVIVRGRVGDMVSDFPQINGLKKEARIVSHISLPQNGKKILQHTVVQSYTAEQEGVFFLEKAKITVNGKVYVLPDIRVRIESGENPDTEDFLSQTGKNTALLFLFVSKKEIFVGESFRIYLAFYVSGDNMVYWKFPTNISAKINVLAERIKPPNCIESQALITTVVEDSAQINNKKYKLYKLLEAVYYPLAAGDIVLPSLNLSLNRALARDSTKFETVNFSSRSFTMHVKPLPEHPLREKVAVGHFNLIERNVLQKVQTGKIINLSLELSGVGNAHTLSFEKPANDQHFDFYPASGSVKQKNGSEQGKRIFTFKVFPKDSGTYDLGKYFRWIYFDIRKGDYDTLQARQMLQVSGSKIVTDAGNGADLYHEIENESIATNAVNYRRIAKSIANVLLFLMLVGMLFIFDFKRR